MGKGSLHAKQERQERLLGLLYSGDYWTARGLAELLGSSQRTVMRDLAELRDKAYPIESEPGRGGGIRLTGRWGIERLSLSPQEVMAMLLSFAIVESLESPFLRDSVSGVRQKIARAFPPEQRESILTLRQRILTGQPASEHVLATYTVPPPEVMETVSQCFFEQRIMQMVYQAELETTTARVIEIQYLLLNWPVWYLLAWDHLRQARRLFRVDRIVSAQRQSEKFRFHHGPEYLEDFNAYFERI